MSKKNDGGAAFPQDEYIVATGRSEGRYIKLPGMGLRDYFAAHAPAEPQKWFFPAMPDMPKYPSVDDYGMTYEESKQVWNYIDDPCYDWDQPFGGPYIDAYQKITNEIKAWHNEFSKQRLVQWPYAWADAMLAERWKLAGGNPKEEV